MAEATYHFPRGFLWGTATASHQVEGNNINNNWWQWESEPDHIVSGEKSGLACDWWGGRWREDFDRAAEAGQNAHRFSIEWSRIQPTPDSWDETALDRYREMARNLVERGMTPLVTLHHFSDPMWITEMGGWGNEDIVPVFQKYTQKVVEALHEYVNLWVTINEPNVLAVSAYLFGDFPPGQKSLSTTQQVMVNLAKAHAAAYQTIHETQYTARVGLAINYRGFQPARSWSPLDRWVAGIHSAQFNDLFPKTFATGTMHLPLHSVRIPGAKNTQDFLGINYYTRELVAFNLFHASEMFGKRYFSHDAEVSSSGFIANQPEGFFEAIKWGLQFNLPMIITENGVDDDDDHMRPRYLIQHLHQLWRAVNFNFPVKGYFHWTLVDNFEWERGWTQRFGLWKLNTETQERTKRPSADLYAEICAENGISSQTVARYAPELIPLLFPE